MDNCFSTTGVHVLNTQVHQLLTELLDQPLSPVVAQPAMGRRKKCIVYVPLFYIFIFLPSAFLIPMSGVMTLPQTHSMDKGKDFINALQIKITVSSDASDTSPLVISQTSNQARKKQKVHTNYVHYCPAAARLLLRYLFSGCSMYVSHASVHA